ncbi:hypothetical protein SUGI_0972470 [Cryptomeria japonica]|uniref:uncharacterized protein LOC131073962 n=1 Tax=Cryptomeria japonica TaxID=3369 RepID=UPI002414BAF4|nr:uncharacterized protein LOC131073962 [Cryptomeria japonica]GLJ46164.1 hypothetical protein SUGI_0972470 [Cryptomeria japonica]
MANLTTHIIASFFIFALGVWHLLCSFKAHLKNPNNYSAKLWYPILSKFKTLELYLQLAGILLAIFYYLVISADFDLMIKGSTPVYRFLTLQTAAVLCIFLILVVVVLIHESTPFLAGIPPGIFFLTAALGFGLQWAVLERGSSLTSTVEGKCEELLGKVAGFCCGCSILLAFQPKLFVAELGLNSGLVLQGLWFFQSGLSVYVRGFIPEGCERLLDVPRGVEGSMKCELEDYKLRALALFDFLFILYVIAVVVIDLTVCGFVGRVLGVRKHGGYEPLDTNHKVQP